MLKAVTKNIVLFLAAAFFILKVNATPYQCLPNDNCSKFLSDVISAYGGEGWQLLPSPISGGNQLCVVGKEGSTLQPTHLIENCDGTCPFGTTLNTETGNCDLDCQPPNSLQLVNGSMQCIANCPNAYTYSGQSYCGPCQNNGHSGLTLDNGMICMSPPPDPCTPSSPNYQGMVNGKPICSPPCPEGTAGGVVNGQWVCVPADKQPPSCQPGTILISDGGNGWACVPGTGNQPPPDSNSDGIPDTTGTPGGSGSGATGNQGGGIDLGSGNGDTINPSGPQSPAPCDPTTDPNCLKNDPEMPSSVSGGGTCAAPPVCTGDAVECAILYQTWAQRCETFDAPTVPNITTVTNSGQAILDAVDSDINNISGSSDPGGFQSATSDYFDVIKQLTNDALPQSGSCSDFEYTIPHLDPIVISCDQTSDLRIILGYFFVIMSFWFVVHLITNLRPI